MILIAHESLSRVPSLVSPLRRFVVDLAAARGRRNANGTAPKRTPSRDQNSADTRVAGMLASNGAEPTRWSAWFGGRAAPVGEGTPAPPGAAQQAGGLERIRSAAANGARLLRQSVVAFGAALIVSFWIAAFTLAYQDRAALHVQMQRDAGNLALVFEQNVAHTVADLDRGIQFLRWAHSHAPANVEWPDIVAQDFVSNRETAQTSVIDANGYMVTSSALLRPPAPMYLGDREHFQAHLNSKAIFSSSASRSSAARRENGRFSSRASSQTTPGSSPASW